MLRQAEAGTFSGSTTSKRSMPAIVGAFGAPRNLGDFYAVVVIFAERRISPISHMGTNLSRPLGP
jgi:hypothetical protein